MFKVIYKGISEKSKEKVSKALQEKITVALAVLMSFGALCVGVVGSIATLAGGVAGLIAFVVCVVAFKVVADKLDEIC